MVLVCSFELLFFFPAWNKVGNEKETSVTFLRIQGPSPTTFSPTFSVLFWSCLYSLETSWGWEWDTKESDLLYFFKKRITNNFSTVVFNNESFKIMLKKIPLKMKSENKENHKELVTEWNDLNCDKNLGGHSGCKQKSCLQLSVTI